MSNKKTWLEFIKEKPDKDSDQNFIKKDEEKKAVKQEVDEIIGKLKNLVFPKNNQQRNLNRETGGLEQEETKNIESIDFWDGRSEEITSIGKIDPLGTSGKKSMIWKAKKQKAEEQKQAKEALGVETTTQKKNYKTGNQQPSQEGVYDSRSDNSQSFTSKINNLRKLKQDRENEGNGNQFSR